MGIRRKLVKFSLVTLGVAAVLVALAIGAVQIAVRQLPNYEDELHAWVASELKLDLEYARLDAAWGWRGPELAFRDANVSAVGDDTPFLRAREASVGFTTFALLRSVVARSPPRVDRLTFDGTELTLVRTEGGGYRMQGAPAAADRERSSVDVPPDIDVLVQNSRVLYLDASRSIAWDFQDVAGSLRRDADVLTLEASASPPSELAGRIEVTAQASVAVDNEPGDRFTGDWRLHAGIDAADLGVVARLFPPSAVVPRAGRGDVAVWLEWRDGVLTNGTAELELADVVLQSPLGADSRFERVALSGDWELTSEAWRFALRDVAVTRGGRAWPEPANVDIDVARDADGVASFVIRSSFVRLEDLTPFFAPLPESRLLASWFALEPRGDLRAVDLKLERSADDRIDYAVTAEFAGLGFDTFEGLPGVTGVTGQVRADSRTGRLELASTRAALDWPTLFRGVLDVAEVRGTLVWRAGQDAVRLVSDDLLVVTPAASLRSNLELTLPMDGSSPELDLRTSISGFDIAAAPPYLPARKMPARVVAWLDDALRGGRATVAEVVFVGPVRAFPFDAGEGEFRATVRVADVQLGFVSDWPAAEDLDGTVEFINASFAARGTGRVLGNRADDVRVGIADLRLGELTLQTSTTGDLDQLLAFLNGAPLIARHLGEDFARLEALAGSADVDLDLTLPLRAKQDYRLTAGLTFAGGELAYRGFTPHVSEVFGDLTFADGALSGTGVQGIFLDGPIIANVGAAAEPGYRSRIDVEGEVTIDAVVDAFNLPYGELLAGQTGWQGTLSLPGGGADRQPAKITVSSNLSGVALRFPEPFAKPPGEPTNLELDIAFPAGGLTMEGYLGATRRFALDFDATPGDERPFRFRRAALEFGGELAQFRTERGVTFDGTLPLLRVDEWLALSRSGGDAATPGRSNWSGALAGANLDIAEFSIFGQRLGSTRLAARRLSEDWQLEIDSNAIAGTVLVPVDLTADPQIVAVMQRLYLSAGDGTGTATRGLDPRNLPGLQLHANEFGVGQRQIGRLDAEIVSDPLGLRLVSFESATDSFTAQGSGGWFMGADGDTTRFAVGINSTNVGLMLGQLGVQPFVEAEMAEITASVFWPGPPSGSWLDHISGDLALRAEKGSLVDVEPGGAGRFAGLLSITALPRRLALDFRDVFNRGLVFDDITADFVMVDGNAYTDNLKLTGPVAEVGIIGRTGLRDRDYRQQAVVTAEPGKVLPTVGALLGGPQVAAALLIFTRIFKKPLLGIGRASYCVTGSWGDPKVERLTDEQLEEGAVCAELPPNSPQRPAAEGIAE